MAIKESEIDQFNSVPYRVKVDCMATYLLGYNGRKLTMAQVAEICTPGNINERGWIVTLITRAYNFSGNNSGKYGPGCSFERKLGRQITKADIEAFVRKYPRGTYQTGITFENFLLEGESYYSDSYTPQRYTFYEKREAVIGFIGLAVLAVLLMNGALFSLWYVSLIALVMALGGLVKEGKAAIVLAGATIVLAVLVWGGWFMDVWYISVAALLIVIITGIVIWRR